MRRLVRIVAALALALAAPWSPTGTASAEGGGIEVLDVDASAAPTIELTVALPDHFAASPPSSDGFTVVEGGTTVPVEATQLRSEIDVALVIDTSGSMAGPAMAAAKAAATEFLGRLDASTRVAVVGFGEAPSLLSPLGTDRAATLQAVQGLVASGETALWDALAAAAAVRQDRDLHVVLLSDGGDTVSSATSEAAAIALREQGAPLYALSLQTGESDRDALAEVVARTGGLTLDAEDPAGLGPLYDQVATRLSNLWRLRFTTVGHGPERLDVAVGTGAARATGTVGALLQEVPATTTTTTTSAPVTTAPAAPLVAAPEPGFLASGMALWLGAGLVGAGILVGALSAGASTVPVLRLSNPVAGGGALRRRVVDAADRAISTDRRGRLELALERADQDLRPAELVVLAGAATTIATLGGLALVGPLLAPVGLLVPLAVKTWLSHLASQRQRRFGEQLPATLMMLSASLRSGRALSQALETLAREAPEPSASEFGRVVIEARIGRDLVEALHRMAERTGSPDFEWAVRAIGISRELGGDLAEVLDNVGETIRDRTQINRQVRSLSAEGRLSAWILLALPVFVAVVVSQTNAGYLDVLLEDTIGKVLIVACLAMFAAGGMWIRRIVQLKY